MNGLMSYYHAAKQNTHHLLEVNPRLTSVRCMLRLVLLRHEQSKSKPEYTQNPEHLQCDRPGTN